MNDVREVYVNALLSAGTNCICDMCHATGRVVKVLMPETKYHNGSTFLHTVYSNLWMCESCRDKLLAAISKPIKEEPLND